MSTQLTPTWQVGDVHLTEYPYSVDRDNAVEIGEPEMVVESLTSMLADGDIDRVVRHGNRVYVIPCYIEGPDLISVAEAEATLRRELKRQGLVLTHDPGDGFAPASAYEVLTAQMTPERSDTHETHLLRKWTLTLTCAPFARSVDPVEVSAFAAGSTTVSVDTCDVTTGWTGTRGGVPESPTTFWEAGAVSVAEFASATGFPPETWTLTRTGAIDTSTTPYIKAEVKTLSTDGGQPLDVSAFVDGVPLPALEVSKLADGSGYFRMVFDASAFGSIPSITFTHTSAAGSHKWQGLFVRQVSRTDVAPNITARQVTRLIDVGGTERTQGSLKVSAPDGETALGLTLVATWPEMGVGFSPPLRRWRVSGNGATADSNTYSGAYEPISPSFVAHDVSVSSLPEGTYQLLGLLRSAASGAHTVESVIQSRHNGVTLGETSWRDEVNFPLPNDWLLVPMGVYRIPIAAAKAGEFRVEFRTIGATDVQYDEAWLLPVDDDCAISIMNVTEPHLWLDSPDLESRVPKVWEGADVDKADAHWPTSGIHTMGRHIFSPGGTVVFTATAGADWPEVTLTYHKRWHSNAAED